MEDTNKTQCPSTYLLPSILVTLFAFTPLGIVAIIFAAQVKSKYHQGDFYGAESASKTARNMCIISTIIALPFYLVFISLISSFSDPKFEQSISKAKQSEAKSYVGTINQAQKSFYLKKGGIFAQKLADLKVSISSETTNYRYDIKTDKIKTISTATAKNDNLKSYTGVVFSIKNTKNSKSKVILIAQLCESDQPSKIPPAAPILVGSEVKCVPGSTTLDKTYK